MKIELTLTIEATKLEQRVKELEQQVAELEARPTNIWYYPPSQGTNPPPWHAPTITYCKS